MKKPTKKKLTDEEKVEITSKINRLRKCILVHSTLYYELNTTLITDEQWDKWAKELVELQKEHKRIASKCVFHKYFKGWKGESGYHLPIKSEWAINKAKYLLYLRDKGV